MPLCGAPAQKFAIDLARRFRLEWRSRRRIRDLAVPVQAPARGKRPRRTQAQRSAETRKKIVDAVIAVAAEEGLARASSARIAARASVTWGAVQHHFGAKADILEAVLDAGLERLEQRVEELPRSGHMLAERVALVVDHAWVYYGSPHFRATLEILLDTHTGDAAQRGLHYEQLAESGNRLWSKAFADLDISAERRSEAERFAFTALFGLAVQRAIQRGAPADPRELDALKRAIARLLAAPAD
jgi:AcrR family transcriptional regulator